MSQVMLAGIIGVGGTLLGVIVSGVVTWRVSDRTRKADLYKIVYPEKLRATRVLMDKAAALHRNVWKLVWDDARDVHDSAVELYKSADGLFHDVQSQEWLLGSTIMAAAVRLHGVLKQSLAQKVFTPSEPHVKGVFEIDENTWEPVSGYNAAFEGLQQAVREELRLEELSTVFPRQKVGSNERK